MATAHASRPADVTQQDNGSQPAEYTHKLRYVLIAIALLAGLLLLFAYRAVQNSMANSTTPAQQGTPNNVKSNATEETGAPVTDTGTPMDRTVPSPSGAGGNTILNQ
ncbi:MAG TPA: hypothetical protein VF572_03170 [Candidatus Saccharimonadales bacterium]|jgi:hypothetical protein